MGGLCGWEEVDGTKTWVGVLRKRKNCKLGENQQVFEVIRMRGLDVKEI